LVIVAGRGPAASSGSDREDRCLPSVPRTRGRDRSTG
jgi:hypothetical protein